MHEPVAFPVWVGRGHERAVVAEADDAAPALCVVEGEDAAVQRCGGRVVGDEARLVERVVTLEVRDVQFLAVGRQAVGEDDGEVVREGAGAEAQPVVPPVEHPQRDAEITAGGVERQLLVQHRRVVEAERLGAAEPLRVVATVGDEHATVEVLCRGDGPVGRLA